MRPLVVVLLLGLVAPLRADGPVITDSVGRRVALPPPERIRKVYPAGPIAAVMLLTLSPERLMGFPMAMDAEQRALLPPVCRELPRTGKITGRGTTANIEEVLKSGADAVLDVGVLAGANHVLSRETADRTGLPTLSLDGSLEALPGSYRLLGRALGCGERAEKLAAYVEKTLAEVKAGLARAGAGTHTRVYYARGPKGLESTTVGSISVEAFERAGAVNVAASAGPRSALVEVSPEDLLVWNPDLIVTIEPAAARHLQEDLTFRGLAAVKAGRVYQAPTRPFGWVDYPPAANRLLGLQWLVRLLHPGALPDDLRERVAEFHRLFYQQPLTGAQLDALLAGLNPR